MEEVEKQWEGERKKKLRKRENGKKRERFDEENCRN